MNPESAIPNPHSAIHNPQSPPTVYVVDDDPSVRNVLSRLIQSAGLRVAAFAAAEDFLKRYAPAEGGCLVLDVRLPGQSGMDLQAALCGGKGSLPIIFITGYGDIPMSVRAMKNGAVDFLAKPFDSHELLAVITIALRQGKEARKRQAAAAAIRGRVEKLTPREREVMKLVVTGLLNKQIGAELGITEKTVKVHRGRVMQKMGVTSVAELVRMCGRMD
ncbi:MAG: response regulator transcription factor [Lentisphaerae bacterium]|nr:response regulator transcription factor [Lentisphaerota bacterium]